MVPVHRTATENALLHHSSKLKLVWCILYNAFHMLCILVVILLRIKSSQRISNAPPLGQSLQLPPPQSPNRNKGGGDVTFRNSIWLERIGILFVKCILAVLSRTVKVWQSEEKANRIDTEIQTLRGGGGIKCHKRKSNFWFTRKLPGRKSLFAGAFVCKSLASTDWRTVE